MRAAVFTVITSLLAAMGHVQGGGHLPDPAVLVTVAVVVGGSLSGSADRRRNGPEIVVALLTSQVVFHLLFTLGPHGESYRAAPQMVGFHLLAGLASAWVMTVGERSLFHLVATLHRAVVDSLDRPRIAWALLWTVLIAGPSGRRNGAPMPGGVSHRGPPAPA